MIGGISPGNQSLYQNGNNSPVRERTEGARAPAASPDANSQAVRQNLADNGRRSTSEPTAPGSDNLARRVEARRAAEDTRLERFQANELPLPTAKALSTFAGVAAAGQDSGAASSLAGIDIIV
ncbi:UDP pyrophosphate phosphatase [Marinobacter koreensis]|uniref:Undecaprenyl pyrophosphate phosphatase-like protein n=2 Tax=Marinobacter TaxID=2742 RepID=M7CYB6_9GAMM|nr:MULTISPECIES: hypothetical protein [Marinobacter]EMP57235.1 undecaprenyl pyrophosphate phosphatase-like protein [Marinobacter santoriniensis NKSG1]MCK7549354.1 UDP pyrophosphate phosphatase [Marinobacter koreensis]